MKNLRFLIAILLIVALQCQAMAAEPPKPGRYTIEAALSGGSGRARIESPAKLTVADGAAMAVIVWSSPNYTYMLIDGVYYHPINTDGASTFEIPVSFDEDIAVTAQTVAMSSPHEINYTLRFDSSTLKPLAQDRAGASFLLEPPVMATGLVVLAAAGLFIIVSRRRAKQSSHENEE